MAATIAVLGAGAMGSLVGARLALAGHDVTLIDADEAHVEAIRHRGLRLRDAGAERVAAVAATTDPAEASRPDAVLVLTKANRLDAALAGAGELTTRAGIVVVLANGLGCADVAAPHVPAGLLAYGAMASGAVVEAPGVVRETFAGDTYVGPSGETPSERLRELAATLTDAGLPTHVVDNIDDRIWTKLLVNVGFNAATALTGVRNGELVEHADGRAILTAAIDEAVAVARVKGIVLQIDDPVGFALELGRTGIATQRSSMLQDVLRGRATEVDFINGAVAREGTALGVPTPVNDALTRLVKVLELAPSSSAAKREGAAPAQSDGVELGSVALGLGVTPRIGSIWVGGISGPVAPSARRKPRRLREVLRWPRRRATAVRVARRSTTN
jgi:2-dehydropantoate 2-reductase